MATVVFDGWSDVPAFDAVGGPAVTLVYGLINDNLGDRWS